jgi:hypothetical protein
MRLVLLAAVLIGPPAGTLAGGQQTARVEGTFVIPKEAAAFAGRLVEIRLYRYDPHLADAAADLVEKVEFKNFAHTAGKETKKEFVVGAKAALDPKLRYYLTLFVLENGKRTHLGECTPGQGPCQVFTWQGKYRLTVLPVGGHDRGR